MFAKLELFSPYMDEPAIFNVNQTLIIPVSVNNNIIIMSN